MAPAHEIEAALQSRSSFCSSGYYYSNGFCYRSGWYGWGRWVLVGVIIFVFVLFLLLMSCRVRRQRRRGVQPSYGTSWMGWGPNQGQPQYNNYGAQPPQYSQQPPPPEVNHTGGTFNSNEGYYGQNAGAYNNDIPLQQPTNTYYPARGAGNEYAPPEGPPPGKK